MSNKSDSIEKIESEIDYLEKGSESLLASNLIK
jgi:hypothetical protein